MKKASLLALGALLFGCANVNKTINVAHPGEHGYPEELEGKIFSISCTGNASADSRLVDDKCKEYISEFAYQKGFGLFSVLDKNSETNTEQRSYTVNEAITTKAESSVKSDAHSVKKYDTTTTYVPKNRDYTVTTYSHDYLFVLIDAAEKDKYKNYYRVSDYYNPNQK
jgi:hypothetical protein